MKAHFDSLIQDSRPVIVDFFAPWCGPCKLQHPILEELAAELGDRVKIIKIDVDQNSNLAGRFRIQSVPTLMIFKDGNEIYRQPGVHTKQQLINLLPQNI